MLTSTSQIALANFKIGDQISVENRIGTAISPGWVLTNESITGPTKGYYPLLQKFYMKLTYISGAPLGTRVEVLGHSPIPPGWEIIETRGNSGLDRQYYNIRYIIEKQYDADSLIPQGLPPTSMAFLNYDIESLDTHNKQKY